MKKRILVALAIGTAVSGGVFASATTLGTISDKSLGAGANAVASCDSDGVSTAYAATYNSTTKAYDATTVTVTGVAPACATKTMRVALVKADGSTAFEQSKTVGSTGTEAFTIPTGAGADTVERVAVAIFG